MFLSTSDPNGLNVAILTLVSLHFLFPLSFIPCLLSLTFDLARKTTEKTTEWNNNDCAGNDQRSTVPSGSLSNLIYLKPTDSETIPMNDYEFNEAGGNSFFYSSFWTWILFGSFCCRLCRCEIFYQGREHLLLNFNNRYSIHYGLLYEYSELKRTARNLLYAFMK